MTISALSRGAEADFLAAVVVPIHSISLSADEHLALSQLTRVLGAFPRVAVVPQSLCADELERRYGLRIERFPDSDFRSVADYNRLMLSRSFYERFATYRYILIHQLDAFVFRDELAHWCQQDFDYIGAPWMARWALESSWLDWFKAPRGWLARRLSNRSGTWLRYATVNQVGNGGFSLRKVQAFLDVLQDPPASLDLYRKAASHYFQEDIFWGIAANRWSRRIRTPYWRTALKFAVEGRADIACTFMDGRLPFGCHAWAKLGSDFWRPHIERTLAHDQEPRACVKQC